MGRTTDQAVSGFASFERHESHNSLFFVRNMDPFSRPASPDLLHGEATSTFLFSPGVALGHDAASRFNSDRQGVQRAPRPYAQLCFDPASKSLVTLMELDCTDNDPASKSWGSLEEQAHSRPLIDGAETRSNLSSMLGFSDYATGIDSSTHWDSSSESTKKESVVLLGTQELWLEETDVDLYLLHECDDPWNGESKRCCTDGIRNFVRAYRAKVISRCKEGCWETAKEPFFGIGYRVLNNDRD